MKVVTSRDPAAELELSFGMMGNLFPSTTNTPKASFGCGQLLLVGPQGEAKLTGASIAVIVPFGGKVNLRSASVSQVPEAGGVTRFQLLYTMYCHPAGLLRSMG
ncbi:MAG TPA: hypothetical protein VFA40_09750 [Terriglobales bacterium]|jgi:hypothetical protein|nr:hypothetical protein [Terriglobales bacterium]